MPSALLLAVLVVGLLALIPVRRLQAAGWPRQWLFAVWVVLAVAGLLVVRFPAGSKFLVPLLVLAFVAPFVAGPERLTRVLGGRRRQPGVVIDVMPRLRIPPPDDPDPSGPEDDAPDR